jgi:hypothetical protein
MAPLDAPDAHSAIHLHTRVASMDRAAGEESAAEPCNPGGGSTLAHGFPHLHAFPSSFTWWFRRSTVSQG